MNVSRRTLLFSGLAAAAPVWAKNHIGQSRLSAITDEIARSPADAIAFAKQYGLQWLELRDVPGAKKGYAFLSDDELHRAADEFRAAGIRISFLNTGMLKIAIPDLMPVRFKTLEPEVREKRLKADADRFDRRFDELNKALNAAKILGVDLVRVFTGWRVEDPPAVYSRLVEILTPMADIAAKEKIHLLVENEGACTVGTSAELAGLFEKLQHPWMGLNWDPLNAVALKENPYPDGYAKLPKKKILNVQFKGKSILGPQFLDWAGILQSLERDDYQGQVGLETHIFGDGQIQASHDSMKAMLKLIGA
jgi:sugar phosphate isomerase/epimerase